MNSINKSLSLSLMSRLHYLWLWWQWQRWWIHCWDNCGSLCWAGKNNLWVIFPIDLWPNICSSMSQYWCTGQWHWTSQLPPLLTLLSSWSAQIGSHSVFTILLHTQQYPCFFLCYCYFLCTQWLMWDWWHVSWEYTCYYFLEMWQTICVFVNTDKLAPGVLGLNVAQARLFLSVTVNCIKYSCAFVHWYSWLGDSVDKNMGMWVIDPDILDDGRPWAAVIHLDTIVHLVHLLPIYGEKWAPRGVKYTDSLDRFSKFYVNKFSDHHTFKIAF